MRYLRLLAAGAALALAMPAQSALILGLFNTGTDATNTALPGGNGVTDPHYTVVETGLPAVTFYQSPYVANDADSRWISWSPTGGPGRATTTYRTTFSLAGFDPATVTISGLWAVDNFGRILLNGAETGQSLPNAALSFTQLNGFSINSGFVSGLNTLDFVVQELGSGTGLRVDNLTGRATALDDAIPEPATWALMIAGFGLAGIALRSRRTNRARTNAGSTI